MFFFCILSIANGNQQHMRASIALSTPLTRFKFQTKNGVVRGTRETKRNQNSTFQFLSGVYAGKIFF